MITTQEVQSNSVEPTFQQKIVIQFNDLQDAYQATQDQVYLADLDRLVYLMCIHNIKLSGGKNAY